MNFSKKQILTFIAGLLLSFFSYYYTTQDTIQPAAQRLLTTTYTTTTTRTNAVNDLCNGLSRTSLLDSSLLSMYDVFSTQIKSMFSLNGNSLVVELLNSDTAAATAQVKENTTQIALFIGPFLLGLVLILLLTPFICCCCTCPNSCPSKCCRKNQDEQYTKCELYWPTTVLILALLLCIGSCIAGFTQSEMIPKTMSSTSCASAIILDDIINGNVSTSGKFFSGLKQIDTQLGYLNGNLTTVNNSMVNLKSSSANMTTVNTAGNTALSDTAKVPNNVNAGGNMNSITYDTPLNSGSPSSTINSIFPATLGSSTTGGYVGSLYTTINSVLTTISAISSTAGSFVTESTNFQSSVSALRTTVQNFSSYTIDIDNSFYSTLSTVNQNNDKVSLSIKLLYGITIGISSAMLLSALLIAFCDKIKCRYLMYFSCTILFFLGILGFLLSVGYSVVAPVIYFGCQFMDFSLSSSANFDSNFGSLIPDITMRGYISTCLPSSSGDLVTALGGGAVNAIQNLSSTLTSISAFNSTQMASIVQSARSTMVTMIDNYKLGYLNDITDTTSINFLTQVSNHSNYAACATPAFATDSWIPSTQENPVYIACQINNGNNATNTECSGGGNFAGATGGCSGCMDTTSIFNTGSYASKAAVLTALNNRYSNGGCSTFNTDLSNIWANYYLLKSNAYSPVSTRAATATTSINQFTANITGTLTTTFNNAVTAMNAAVDSVTNSKYGLVAGLNCNLIGEDFSTFTETFCKGFFTVAYFSRLALGCASFGILFSICCGACTGVRFYKHSIRKLNSTDNAGLSDEEVQDITNTNFVKPKRLQ